VTALPGGAAARLEVFSERGMGSAAIEFAPAAWPSAVTLRLHLCGLESLSNGTEGTAAPIAPGSPFWMAVHRTPHTDDLRALRFGVAAPAAFFIEGLRDFAFDWLDFYR
jgi:hypothetical protein